MLVQGTLRNDNWEDKTTGAKRVSTKVRVVRFDKLRWKDKASDASSTSTPVTEFAVAGENGDGLAF